MTDDISDCDEQIVVAENEIQLINDSIETVESQQDNDTKADASNPMLDEYATYCRQLEQYIALTCNTHVSCFSLCRIPQKHGGITYMIGRNT